MPGFELPFALRRPAGERKPRPILLDPNDRPLPGKKPLGAARPGAMKGRVPANKGKRYPVEILTPREVAAILDEFPADERCGMRYRAIVAVLYRSGLRINEALHLRSKDIDKENGMIRVLFGKGQRARTVGIDQGGIDFIEAWEGERGRYGYPAGAPLFCTSTGRVMSSSNLRLILKRIGERAGVEKRVHAHGFRHTFAFELIMEGVPLPIIQVQLGHVWATSTSVYVDHIAPMEVVARIRGRSWILPPSIRPPEADRRSNRLPT